MSPVSFVPTRPDIKISAEEQMYVHKLSLDLINNDISKAGIKEVAWRKDLFMEWVVPSMFLDSSEDIAKNIIPMFPGDIIKCSTGVRLIQDTDPPAYFRLDHQSTKSRDIHGGLATASEKVVMNARAYGKFIPVCKSLPVLSSKKVYVLDTYEQETIHVTLINHSQNSIVLIPHNYLVLEVDLLFKVIGFN